MVDQQERKGSVFGGILLVVGCCTGAGMLGLPVLSAMTGFIPSIFIFFICWLFMVTTGLLLLEVNLWFDKEVSLISMAEKTLGLAGKTVSWLVYLFLFYSLMVAYVAASGSLISSFADQFGGVQIPHWVGSFLFTLILGILIYRGTWAVDWFNRFLMLGLVVTYTLLIISGLGHINLNLLEHHDWTQMTPVIPAVIVSFGFHNLVPSLTTYLKHRVKSIKQAIIIGSLIPFFIYLIWEAIILGLVPLEDFRTTLANGDIATQALKKAVGSSWILDVAESFAFFAIVTSLLSVALSFVDFLADGLKIKKNPSGKIALVLLVLLPPFLLALVYPTIFLTALKYAGGLGAVLLFGILPALMVWKGRYQLHNHHQQLVPGGKPILIVIVVFALWIMGLQIF
jgi:tyrosine-specific transport protein